MGAKADNGLAPAPPRVSVAAFGKHPGWDDHIDDIGVDTEGLAAFKRRLYVGGIGGNIDAGTWERLPEAQRLPGFRHVFASVAPGERIVGRLWASSDGKGRKRYPMCVCVQAPEFPLPRLLADALPRLGEIEELCRATTSAASVRSLIGATRSDIVSAVAQAREGDALLPGWFAETCAPERLERLGENGGGFARLLYRIEREMAAFVGGAPADPSGAPAPQHIRLPATDADDGAAFTLWAAVFAALLKTPAPVFLARPAGANWIDAIVGDPRPPQFYCLLAGPDAIPTASDIPYSLDEDFMRHARGTLDAWRAGNPDLQARALAAGEAAPPPAPQGVRKLFRLFGGR